MHRQSLQDLILNGGGLHAPPTNFRLLVTAPPAAGKTSLMNLLKRRLITEHSKRVLDISGIGAPQLTADENQAEIWLDGHVKSSCRSIMPCVETLDDAMNNFHLIIIDDAQGLYPFPSLWQRLMKHTGSAAVVCFASISPESGSALTPWTAARIGWDNLRLSQLEREQYVETVLAHPSAEPYLKLLNPMLAVDSGGHMGLLRRITYELMTHIRDYLQSKSAPPDDPDDDEIQHRLQRFYFGAIFDLDMSARFFGAINLPHEEQAILGRLLQGQMVAAPPAVQLDGNKEDVATSAKRYLLRMVIVVVTDFGKDETPTGRLAFATEMHKRYFFRMAFPSIISEQTFDTEYKDALDKWIIRVVKSFLPEHLRNPNNFGTGNKKIVLETVFQHEFWRCGCLWLPSRYRIAAEVTKIFKKNARTVGATRLDFWVNSRLNWAIELVREGGKEEVKDHLKRFGSTRDGKYYSLRPAAWFVVDLRSDGKGPVHIAKGLITIVFARNWSKADVYLEEEEKQTIHLTEPRITFIEQFRTIFSKLHP